MATKKKEDTKKKGGKEKDAEKEAKRKARMEALKNRPAEQRPNSKQIDVIKINDKSEVQNYGYAVKNKEGYQGVVVTSVLVIDGKPTSTSVTFVPGTICFTFDNLYIDYYVNSSCPCIGEYFCCKCYG